MDFLSYPFIIAYPFIREVRVHDMNFSFPFELKKSFENIKVSLRLLQVKGETPIYIQLQFFCYKSKIHMTRKLVLTRSQNFTYQLDTNNSHANLMEHLLKNLSTTLIFSSMNG